MRKTLTVISIAVAATSLAACKMFWEHDPAPPAVATATSPTDPTATDASATVEAAKPTEPTASMSTDKPPVPATK